MSVKVIEPHKSSIGQTDANIIALLTYVAASVIAFIPGIRYFAWITPLILYYMEKESDFVKFHAIQSFVLNGIGAVLGFLLSVVIRSIFTSALYNPYRIYSALGATSFISTIATITGLIILAFAIFALINAYQYKEYRIPIVGNLTDSVLKKLYNIEGDK